MAEETKSVVLLAKGRLIERESTDIVTLFFKQGLVTQVVRNGREVLHLISERETSLPLVIADIQLSGIDGYELCQKINALFEPAPRVILVGQNTELDHNWTLGVGGYFLPCPIDTEKLLKLVYACLSPRRQSRDFLQQAS
ncbi:MULTISPECIES: response regulator [unclassified Coleofasciculus]|uniref:response regulator n=1 Tax=unclassified Coleofasciculus TaxID=2692782 RepID=UPI001882428F|nr:MULTISPECIES: response regulator [unclassified Coleofasciculus]MBE9124750.1 response regulator [Coleofasciculus sp. LEGE 07081]MBE9148202.1 response regulator [Coleofasciculus sp. LEGE 07092]